MANSLQTLLRHAAQGIWTFLNRARRFDFKRTHPPLLPTASPAPRPQITINLVSPLGVKPCSSFMSSNSAWIQDKERFLRRPTLARSNSKLQARERRHETKIGSALSRPEICIEDWSSPEIPLSDLQDPTSVTTSASGPGPAANPTEKPPSDPPTPNVCKPDPEKTSAIEKQLDVKLKETTDGPISPTIVKSPPLRAEKIRLTFEPIQRTPNPHSAVRDFFYDPPSNAAPASMVPMPIFTSSPPPEPARPPTDDGTARLSLLPYPDLFDFSMYDARASQESARGLRISLAPATTPASADSSTVCGPRQISYRDRYRNSAYSRLNGLCTPAAKAAPMSSKIPPSVDRIGLRPRRPLGQLPLASISFNTPTRTTHTSTPPALGLQDSLSLYSAEAASGDWNITSLDDISTRLREACHDLSRCAWTEEEFLRIISP